jgi:glutamate-1-semialdehyde aminotransferase
MQAAQDTFISSTYWTEAIGPTAALATIKKLRATHAQQELAKRGVKVRAVWERAAERHDILVQVSGTDPLLFFAFKHPHGQIMKTVFVTEMLKRGFLASNLYYASLAHTDRDISGYEKALNEVFALMADAFKQGTLTKLLQGPVAHTGFARLN